MNPNGPDDPTTYVLRSLAGIPELEAILESCERHPSPKWAPERDQAEVLAAKLSQRHFGMTDADTRYQKDHLLRAYENEHNRCVWEQDFDFLDLPFEKQVAVWEEELGWDVRAADGGPLRSLEFLGRQIVAVMLGIGGHPPVADNTLSAEAERELEQRLLAEAGNFRRRR